MEGSFRFRSVLSVWLGAFVLCTPAFLNNFPFLYADTGTYLMAGFRGYPSDIRAMTYGIFLRHVSLMESLWLVILVQGLMVSWAIHTFYRSFSTKYLSIAPLASILVLTCMTGIGEVTGMLMPDFLAPVMILCGAILLFGENISRWRQVMAGILFVLSVACHHSHAYIFFLLLAVGAVYWAYQFFRKKPILFRSQRLLIILGLTLAGYFTIPALHYQYSGEFYWSKAKSVFLTNRINQMGLLKPFLREHCPRNTYNLCASIEDIPFDFLWDSNSPMVRSGGMAANDAEYGRMLEDFFAEPGYARKFFIRSVENGVIQFFTFEGKIIFKEREEGYPYQVFQEVWPEFIPAIRRSIQYADQWDSRFTQHIQRFLVYGGFFFCIAVLLFHWPGPGSSQMRQLIIYILLSLLANAVICGGISMVDMRFQYRVVWLIPLIAIWVAFENYPMWRNKIKQG